MSNLHEMKRSEFLSRAQAYRATFNNPMGEQVLADLAKFCRAHESTFNIDARVHAAMEGRREVYLRLRDHLDMTDEELIQRYVGNIPSPTQENPE